MSDEFTFMIEGRIRGESATEAEARLHRVLHVLGFSDIGDGSLWLNRPRDGWDDKGMALGELEVFVDDLRIGPVSQQ